MSAPARSVPACPRCGGTTWKACVSYAVDLRLSEDGRHWTVSDHTANEADIDECLYVTCERCGAELAEMPEPAAFTLPDPPNQLTVTCKETPGTDTPASPIDPADEPRYRRIADRMYAVYCAMAAGEIEGDENELGVSAGDDFMCHPWLDQTARATVDPVAYYGADALRAWIEVADEFALQDAHGEYDLKP
ncbi:MAG TPA: hypothetical protein DD491_11255 [Halieaceae bacterium]|nr:hypothetical protein [Halieaceae bacterium]